MAKMKKQEDREHRIMMEIVVDAYNEDERAMGWYCYLDDTLNFPFQAKCTSRREISPLRVGDKVEVLGMPSESECEKEMFVTVHWSEGTLAVPLAQLEPVESDKQTAVAVEDWRYWVARGYEF